MQYDLDPTTLSEIWFVYGLYELIIPSKAELKAVIPSFTVF
jgi:hypothetical protein